MYKLVFFVFFFTSFTFITKKNSIEVHHFLLCTVLTWIKSCGWEAVVRMRNGGRGEKRRLEKKGGNRCGFEDTGRIFLNLCSPRRNKTKQTSFSMSQFINKVVIYVHAQPVKHQPAWDRAYNEPLTAAITTVHPSVSGGRRRWWWCGGVREECTFRGKLKMEGGDAAHGCKGFVLRIWCRCLQKKKIWQNLTVTVTRSPKTLLWFNSDLFFQKKTTKKRKAGKLKRHVKHPSSQLWKKRVAVAVKMYIAMKAVQKKTPVTEDMLMLVFFSFSFFFLIQWRRWGVMNSEIIYILSAK